MAVVYGWCLQVLEGASDDSIPHIKDIFKFKGDPREVEVEETSNGEGFEVWEFDSVDACTWSAKAYLKGVEKFGIHQAGPGGHYVDANGTPLFDLMLMQAEKQDQKRELDQIRKLDVQKQNELEQELIEKRRMLMERYSDYMPVTDKSAELDAPDF